MKIRKRWMASIVKTSRLPAPALPFSRTVRRQQKAAPAARVLRSA